MFKSNHLREAAMRDVIVVFSVVATLAGVFLARHTASEAQGHFPLVRTVEVVFVESCLVVLLAGCVYFSRSHKADTSDEVGEIRDPSIDRKILDAVSAFLLRATVVLVVISGSLYAANLLIACQRQMVSHSAILSFFQSVMRMVQIVIPSLAFMTGVISLVFFRRSRMIGSERQKNLRGS